MMRSFPEVGIRQIGFIGFIALTAVAEAMAASNVGFTLELGGDNHAAAYKAGSPLLFTPGSTTDGQVFPAGTPVTWAVRLSASGIQAAGNGAGSPINGVANFVFDVEIHSGTVGGPLVTTAQFLSTLNDGANGDLLTSATFAMSFNLQTLGPGRVVDPQSGAVGRLGGPLCGGVDTSADRLRSATYPTPEQGKLVGMGAGYNAWKACCGSAKTTPGIGMDGTIPAGGNGLGSQTPVCEGQIGNLAMGTYVLKVIPAAGNNVLRGDINLGTDQNAFATAADGTTGDTITFTVGNPAAGKATNPSPANGASVTSNPVTLSWTAGANAVSHDVLFGTTNPPPLVNPAQAGTTYAAGSLTNNTYYWRIDEKNVDGYVTTGDVWSFTIDVTLPVQITEWRSVRTHGGAGDQAIALNAAAPIGPNVTSEPRLGGMQRIQVDFNQPVALLDPEAIVTAAGSDGEFYDSTSVALIDADTLQIDYTGGLPDQVCYTMNLSGLISSADFSLNLTGDRNCVVRNLYGDANSMNASVVSLSDALLVQARAGSSVAASPWADLNLSGAIDNADALAAKSQLGHSACP